MPATHPPSTASAIDSITGTPKLRAVALAEDAPPCASHPLRFADLALGQTASARIRITPEMINTFAAVTGDHNPIHTDPAYAHARFGGVIAHGVLLVGFFSALLATSLPGPGALARDLKVRFRAPVRPGDDVDIEVKIVELVPRIRKAVLEGRARVGANLVLNITAETLLEG